MHCAWELQIRCASRIDVLSTVTFKVLPLNVAAYFNCNHDKAVV